MKKGESQLEAALERCGVVVAKAPKGMTRSKQNETLVTKRYIRHPRGICSGGSHTDDLRLEKTWSGQWSGCIQMEARRWADVLKTNQ